MHRDYRPHPPSCSALQIAGLALPPNNSAAGTQVFRPGVLGACAFPSLLASILFMATACAQDRQTPPVDGLETPQPPPVSADGTGTPAPGDETYQLLSLFADTLDQIERNYVQEISRRELMEAAIAGMLRKLDAHSNYIPPKHLDELRTEVESEFGGLGIRISARGGQLHVISPLYGTPAFKAGILAGDRILSIDGVATEGMTSDEAVRRLKGTVGSKVRMGVLHAHNETPEEVEVTRQIIRLETVVGHRRQADHSWDYWIDPERKIAYIRITSFSRHTAEELRRVMQKLREANATGLVLDLRYNPGGLLSAAVEVSDMFLKTGRIVSTAGRNVTARSWDATPQGTFDDVKMITLVNRYSASASEIVAACLQDHHRSNIAGERTWGKGSVQNIIELEGGRSALKLTTAGYRRPSGRNIQRFPDSEEADWGVVPDEGLRMRITETELFQIREAQKRLDVLNSPAAKSTDEGDAADDDTQGADRQLDVAVGHLLAQVKQDTP